MAIFSNPPKMFSLTKIVRYIDIDLFRWCSGLVNGLYQLDFKNNFQSFLVKDQLIDAGATVKISNGFRDRIPGLVPSCRIIVKQTGDGVVTDGIWTSEYCELINNGAVQIKISVIFLKEGAFNA